MNLRPAAARSLAAVVLTTLAFGCAKHKPVEQFAQAPVVVQQDDVLTPVVRGGTNGLEVLWFVCRDEQDSLARALAPYLYQPVELPEETAQSLARNGVRIVRVPLADFGAVRSSLRPVGPTERAWLGWSLHWSEAFRARSIAARSTVLFDGDPVTLGSSGSRFIARAWGAPTVDGERVRVELATQLLGAEPIIAPFDPLLQVSNPLDISAYELRRGEVLDQLAFEAQLEPGFAYFLAPASPDEDWVAIAEGRSRSEADAEPPAPGFEFAETPRDISDLSRVFGPPAPAPLTIGQAILTSWDPFETRDEALERKPMLKAVIALVPRCDVPARLLQPIATPATPATR
jgi:hypothetical protein